MEQFQMFGSSIIVALMTVACIGCSQQRLWHDKLAVVTYGDVNEQREPSAALLREEYGDPDITMPFVSFMRQVVASEGDEEFSSPVYKLWVAWKSSPAGDGIEIHQQQGHEYSSEWWNNEDLASDKVWVYLESTRFAFPQWGPFHGWFAYVLVVRDGNLVYGAQISEHEVPAMLRRSPGNL